MVHLAIVLIVLLLYFLPMAVASDRRHRSFWGIAVVNFFLGWTFLGWVIALAWAANSNVESKTTNSTE